jgi:trimethylamine--corrinoid protein Co-methyltransferase
MTRRRHREKRVANALRQLPWGEVVNPYAATQILSEDQLETIIQTSLDVLRKQGMRFLEPGSRDTLRSAGAEVDDEEMIVRFDPAMVMENLAHAPAEFGLRARNPARDLKVGGNNILFASVGGPAFCSDLDKGRRRKAVVLSKQWIYRPKHATWICTSRRYACSTRIARRMRWDANAPSMP